MVDLSETQITFLRSQNIALSSLFDATGMKKADYQLAMTADRKNFAFGVTPCNAAGHTLRTRAGHCIQCDHAKIAYMLRFDARAYIYIAASKIGHLIKIGSSIDIADRRDKLNQYQYGGQNDWQILATANSAAAGRTEFEAHAQLACWSVPGEYVKAGKKQRCYELFQCNFSDARDALISALGNDVPLIIPNEEHAMAAFNFRQ